MVIRRLHPKRGFAQRHSSDVGVTKYLRNVITDLPFHRSAVTLSLIRDDLMEFNNDTTQPNDSFLDYAISVVTRDYFLPEKVKMIHLNDVFGLDLDIWSSSPGLPWKDMGYKTKNDIRHDYDAIQSVRRFWHFVKQGKNPAPYDSLAYVRSHVAPLGKDKIRAIWGYPATITFGEAVFALPLIKAYSTQRHRHIAYGYEIYTGGMKKLFHRFSNHPYYQALDFSKFDKTVPRWLIETAFKILQVNIDFGNYQDYGVADARKTITMWEYIKSYFIYTPIRLCNGERYQKDSGVASGSYFTQLIDSIVNSILVTWLSLKYTGAIPLDYMVLGDDSLTATHKPITLHQAAALFISIGMFINVEKSKVSEHLSSLKFLGYEINQGYPSRPQDELLAALAFPERQDRCVADVQSRALGVMYANLGVHKYVHDLCTRIVKFRQFDLILSPNMRRFLKHVLGIETFHVGEPPTQHDFIMKVL